MLLVAIKILQGHYPAQSICSAVQSICVGEITWQQSLFLFLQKLTVTTVLSVLCTKNISVVRFRFQHITRKKKRLELNLIES